jgi:hypothetical protein
MKINRWINFASLILVGVLLGLTSSLACEQNPGKISISVSGAQAASDQNYYVVEIPEQGKTNVTITGSGQTPCPTDQEKCKCGNESAAPETDGDPKYTFTKAVGEQDPTDGPTVKWEVDSLTSPGEYKFKVTRIEQAYKACAQGLTGGVSSKSNTQQSDETTVLAYKIETETIATKPQDRKRKKVGVGEEVNLTFKPSSITINWSVEGNKGSIAPATGTTTIYTAHNETTEGKVRAEFKGASKVTSFDVVEPSGVSMEVVNSLNSKNPFRAGFKGQPYILPKDVNFEKISIYEGQCNGVGIDYFAPDNDQHQVGATVGMAGFVDGKGTKVNATDTIFTTATRTPYTNGTFTWLIPWSYKLGGADKLFATVNHEEDLTVANGVATLKMSKGGASQSETKP